MSNTEDGNETEHLDVGVLVCYLPKAWSYKNWRPCSIPLL